MLYQSPDLEEEELYTAELANKAGVSAHVLSNKEVQQLEPDLTVSARGGIYFKDDAFIHPDSFMQDMVSFLKLNTFVLGTKTKVSGFIEKDKKIHYCPTKN
jgi:D-amino-acid dehydrogenase